MLTASECCASQALYLQLGHALAHSLQRVPLDLHPMVCVGHPVCTARTSKSVNSSCHGLVGDLSECIGFCVQRLHHMLSVPAALWGRQLCRRLSRIHDSRCSELHLSIFCMSSCCRCSICCWMPAQQGMRPAGSAPAQQPAQQLSNSPRFSKSTCWSSSCIWALSMSTPEHHASMLTGRPSRAEGSLLLTTLLGCSGQILLLQRFLL